jgi:hypothetical protein
MTSRKRNRQASHSKGVVQSKRAARVIRDPLHIMLGDIRVTRRLAAALTAPLGINASGDIVGTYNAGHGLLGFLFRGGIYTTLDMHGIETQAWGINASGHIV